MMITEQVELTTSGSRRQGISIAVGHIGFLENQRVFLGILYIQEQLGMKVQTARMCSYPWGFIGGRELQKQWAQGSQETSMSIFRIFW